MDDKVKVFEIAEEANSTSAEVIKKAQDLGISLKSPQSTVTFEEAEKIAEYIMTGKTKDLKQKNAHAPEKVLMKKRGLNIIKKKNSSYNPPIIYNNKNSYKVFEIAQETNLTSAEVIEKAKDLAIKLKSPQSQLTLKQAQEVKYYILNGESDLERSVILISKETNLTKEQVINIAKSLKVNLTFTNKLNKETENNIINFINNGKNNINKINIYDIALITNLTPNYIHSMAIKLGIKLESIDSVLNKLELDKIIKYIFQYNSLEHNYQQLEQKHLFSKSQLNYKFPYRNILFKGVPGTGKSRAIDNIIKNYLNNTSNKLRVNIHSATSNSDLMQGIGIHSQNNNLEYKEKQGLILNFIQQAIFKPLEPFVLILEEIQENSLNELIGDLIYLIEDDKRTVILNPDNKEYSYSELLESKINNLNTYSVKMPNLVSDSLEYKEMILPSNLFIFCTSNYRDDKKIIEDNLLRRFEVIEIYPKYKKDIKDSFKNQIVSNFLEDLNDSILKVCKDKGEIHPDRFLIGHSIWLNVNDEITFKRSLLKVITEFKDIKDIHFDDFIEITKNIKFPFDLKKNFTSYKEWIIELQKDCYNFLDQ